MRAGSGSWPHGSLHGLAVVTTSPQSGKPLNAMNQENHLSQPVLSCSRPCLCSLAVGLLIDGLGERERDMYIYFTPAWPECGHMAATSRVACRSVYLQGVHLAAYRWPIYLLYNRGCEKEGCL